MEATDFGTFLVCMGSANLDGNGSFLGETGVVGAEGIFSIKSFGSRIAGLTIGSFAPCGSGSLWREVFLTFGLCPGKP